MFSNGVGKVSLIDKEIRSESFSTDLTLTLTASPTDTTSSGVWTCSWDNSETWTKPSTPPISMKAPKLVNRATLPSITSPSFKESNIEAFLASFSNCSTALRLKMTLLFSGSSSSTLIRIVWPSNTEKSSMKSVEIREAGTNPLWPTSTTKPPLTTSVTSASITSSLSSFSCKYS